MNLSKITISSLIVLLFMSFMATIAAANTFTVTNTSDDPINPAFGSLRWAVLQAAANPGTDLINFSIGTGIQRIELAGQIDVNSPVEIDGNSQPGTGSSPKIELSKNYTAAAAGGGLNLSGGNSKIHGLRFLKFVQFVPDLLIMAVEVRSENNSIYGNVFGAESGNGEPNDVGIKLFASNNRIGFYLDGTNEISAPNLFRKNYIGIASEATGKNSIKGNLIVENDLGINDPGSFYSKGIETDGRNDGLEIIDNTIFGSGPEGYGIFLNATENALIQFNRIGVNANGTETICRINQTDCQFDGIDLKNGSGNRIFDNVISGHLRYGVNSDSIGTRIERNDIGLGGDGQTIIPNDIGILLQNQGGIIGGDNGSTPGSIGNYITGNINEQVKLAVTSGGLGVIQGNIIGLTRKEGNPGSNTGTGVGGTTSSGTVRVGGTTPGTHNIISGNFADGIRLGVDSNGTGVTNVEITGNCIGTNKDCSVAVTDNGFGNHFNGIRIDALASIIQITGNIIAFNGERGIYIPTQPQQNISGNNVEISQNTIFGNRTVANMPRENVFLGRNGTNPINDLFDLDDGGNRLQNGTDGFVANRRGNIITIGSSHFFGRPSTPFEIQFFYQAQCTNGIPSTESRYIVSTRIYSDANGDATFNNVQFPIPSDLPSDGFVQAVVINRQIDWTEAKKGLVRYYQRLNHNVGRTDKNNSSEYSPCVAVTAGFGAKR